MSNEIKKILDNIQEHLKEKEENFKKGAVDSTVYYLYCDNAKILLDYITNLQQENEKLNKECDTYMKISTQKQSRIDKAIKWIDYDNMEIYFECPKKEMKELLNILKGENKE